MFPNGLSMGFICRGQAMGEGFCEPIFWRNVCCSTSQRVTCAVKSLKVDCIWSCTFWTNNLPQLSYLRESYLGCHRVFP